MPSRSISQLTSTAVGVKRASGIPVGIPGLGFGGEAANGFSPASLFSSGEEGVWYDPSDLSTVWADTAGTTPASVNGAVARIDDKSGNGNHAIQATAAARPILRQSGSLYYLEFDGVDDYLSVSSPGFNLTDMSFWAGVQQLDATANEGFVCYAPNTGSDFARTDAIVFEASNKTIAKATVIAAFGTAGGVLDCQSSGTGATPLGVWEFTKDATTASLLYDGVVQSSDNSFNALTAMSGDFLLGARFLSGIANHANCTIYGLISRNNASSTTQEATDARQYIADLSGVTL